jgi:glutamate N-acetyltransferase/amino-acid N-acetyltransferase
VCREHLADGSAKAVVLNSGNANACTGEEGLANARRMCGLTAEMLGLDVAEVLVCSTGVIGVQLPMEAIETGIPQAAKVLSGKGGNDAAEAIMTTDTVPKTFAVEVDIAGVKVRIGGMAKGSGMIAPNMATMLSVITTDADIAPELLRKQLGLAVRRSFNCITVDGDMSTNDTVIVLANGASGAPAIEGSGEAADDFYAGLEMVCRELARLIARDGEGATKLVSIRVNGAGNEAEARQVGLSVANSNLVKTAVFGRDPNWGRILCAVGYAGVDIDPDKVAVSLCGTPIYGAGAGLDFDKDRLIEAMGAEDIPIEIDLGQGPEQAEIFTCDFSYDYVRINAEYTT